MKYLVKFFVVTFFFIISTHSFAEQKIVVLDMKYVLNSSKSGKGAQEFLKKKFNNNAKKFTELEKSLKKEETDLLATKANITKEEYTTKSDSLRKKVIDYQSQRRSSIDKLQNQRDEARKTIMKRVKPILNTYINENGVSMIIDKESMIIGSAEHDITKTIVEKLDKEFPSLNLQ